MKILYLDIDTLRPDHLGCYGYHRDTSPNIDRIAGDGVVFRNCYASDVPCLPSRTALYGGQFGIHSGVINHGGINADLPLEGPNRSFRNHYSENTWMSALRRAGYHTVSVSPFAERHSAWHFCAGFSEMFNTGKSGNERADEVAPVALDWLSRHGQEDNWFLQVNFWDPHTVYRTPTEYGNPFENETPPSWLTDDIRSEHYDGYGPHSAREPWGYEPPESRQLDQHPRVPSEIGSMEEWKQWIDGYDVGIRYADDHIGMILEMLASQGVLDDTAIIVSSDHGENQGELNVYGDHQTADHHTCNIPLVIRWPGMASGVEQDGLCYNVDLAATVTEMAGGEIPQEWDGYSFAPAVGGDDWPGRRFLVISQGAWACQRSVRWGRALLMETHHDGFKMLEPLMLFDLKDDPHELNNLAETSGDLVRQGLSLLHGWESEMMRSSAHAEDPMWHVLREGGPHHTLPGHLTSYCEYLRRTDREHHAETLEKIHSGEHQRENPYVGTSPACRAG